MNVPFGHRVANDGVAALRRRIYAKDKVSRADFELVLAHEGGDAPDYTSLLCDVAIDLVVRQADPPNYISAHDAAWLIAAVRARNLPRMVEFRLLTQVMHHALSTPPALSAFCVAEIESAIVAAGVVQPAHTEVLRKAVFATDEGQSLHVTRDEAEALFRIADATAGRANDPAFDDFFARAIGNYLMAIPFRGAASAAERSRIDNLDEDRDIGGFLGQMFSSLSLPTADDLTDFSERCDARIKAKLQADAGERAVSEQIDASEAEWLVRHLLRDGALTAPEKALLAFLKQEVGQPPEILRGLFLKAGV
jgi:hypothetical protein